MASCFNFVFLQNVMVKIILQKIYMQHFSIKWFDIPNLHRSSIILPSKDIKIILHVSHSEPSITKHALNKLLVHLANDLNFTDFAQLELRFLCILLLGVHLSLWQIIKHLFQTSLFWNMKIYSRKFSWICCTLWSNATKHNRQFCLIKWIGLLTPCYCNLQ